MRSLNKLKQNLYNWLPRLEEDQLEIFEELLDEAFELGKQQAPQEILDLKYTHAYDEGYSHGLESGLATAKDAERIALKKLMDASDKI